MAVYIGDIRIDRVAIIDDMPDSRDTLNYELQDGNLNPFPLDGQYDNVEQILKVIEEGKCDSAVSDHQLIQGNLAPCYGADIISQLYHKCIPGVLITRWNEPEYLYIREHRRYIPKILTQDDAYIDNIITGFELCISEFKQQYKPSRKPWKTLIIIERIVAEGKHKMIDALIPAWDPKHYLRFLARSIPDDLQEYVKEGSMFFAKVNLGAEVATELYLVEFEYRK